MDDSIAPPFRRRRLVEDIAEELETAIVDGVFPVDEKLPSEERLATDLRVGRRAIREALKVLETKGLVEIQMGVGAVVRRNDFDNFLETLTRNVRSYLGVNRAHVVHVAELRLLLEGAALKRLSALGDDTTWENLGNSIASQRDAVESGDYQTYQQWHFTFHEQIVDSLDNPIVSMLYKHVMALMRSPMERAGSTPSRAVEAIADHERIVAAVRSAAGDEMDDALRTHLHHFFDAMHGQDVEAVGGEGGTSADTEGQPPEDQPA